MHGHFQNFLYRRQHVQTRIGTQRSEVSALGLGCWAMGGPWTIDGPAGWGQVDDAEIDPRHPLRARPGINFFDTAANYGCGHSERVLGQALAGRRDHVILATKFGYVVDERNEASPTAKDVVPRIREECEDSLRRLNTDYIDLYQFHKGDYPPEQAAEVRGLLETLVHEGKIRWYGWSTDQPEGAGVFAQGPHCTAIQLYMNMSASTPAASAGGLRGARPGQHHQIPAQHGHHDRQIQPGYQLPGRRRAPRLESGGGAAPQTSSAPKPCESSSPNRRPPLPGPDRPGLDLDEASAPSPSPASRRWPRCRKTSRPWTSVR